jgi:putative NIF3 family GTP cyclohydrolase 1 type 2
MRVTTGSLLLLSYALLVGRLEAGEAPAAPQRLTARQVIERIRENVHGEWSDKTVDTFKSGDPHTPVTGVATTFLATLDVLQRAVASGKNLVITHEPTFYNHFDNTQRFESDEVVAAKQAFIKKHGIIIWRFHDHWHKRRPDGIIQGMTERLGWGQYCDREDPSVYHLPETTAERLASDLAARFKTRTIRVVGNSSMKCSGIALVPGASGSAAQIRMLQRADVQVVLAGETPEWETVEYVRDAVAAGKQKCLILLGHANSEEAGMEYCARWLKTFIPEVPIEFLPAGDPFWTPR